MKTLLIAKFFPPVKGGSTRWYEEIYTRYSPGSIVVLTQKTSGYQEYDSGSGLKTIRMQGWGDASLHPKHFKTYFAILRKALHLAKVNRVAIIHCDTVLPAGLIGFILSKILNIPSVVYAHGEEINLYLGLFPERNAISFIYRRATAVIANSRFTQKQLLQLQVQKSRIHLISPGVDTKMFSPGLPKEYWQQKLNLNGERILLTVGRLSERKGQDQVIRTLPILLKNIPNLIYLIAGAGKEESRLQQLTVSLGVQKSVRFLGYVEDALLPALYNLSEIVIMPNRETGSKDIEGFGMVFLEANACGKPVIAGKSGGTASAVVHGKTGFLVDANNLEEISNAVQKLLDDQKLSMKLGKYGRERAVQKFDWGICFRKIQKLGSPKSILRS